MKNRNKIIIGIIVFIVLIFMGWVTYIFLNPLCCNPPTKEEFNASNYCEYDSVADTCLPVSSCEFQIDSGGTKVCLGKYNG